MSIGSVDNTTAFHYLMRQVPAADKISGQEQDYLGVSRRSDDSSPIYKWTIINRITWDESYR